METSRAEALCVQIGGDEFAALVPNTTRDQAKQTAHRARERVCDRASKGVPVTLSGGVYELGCVKTGEQLQRRADQALYAARHAGRDTVHCCEMSCGGTEHDSPTDGDD